MPRFNTLIAGAAGLVIVMGMASAEDYSKTTTNTTDYANGDSTSNAETVKHSVSSGDGALTEKTSTYKTSTSTYAPPPPPPMTTTTRESTTTTSTGN